MRMTRACLLLVLSLALAAGPFPSRAAWEGPDRFFPAADFGRDTLWGSGLAIKDGLLIMPIETQMMTLDPVSGKISSLPLGLSYPDLIGTDERAMLFDHEEGLLYPFTIGEGAVTLGEPLRIEGWKDFTEQVMQGFRYILAEEYLYTLHYDYSSQVNNAQALTRISLAGGQPQPMPGGPFLGVTPYRDGKLLALLPSSEEGGAPLIAVYDPESGGTDIIRPVRADDEKSPPGEAWGMLYDGDRDTLYLAIGQGIYICEALGPGLPIASLPLSWYTDMGMAHLAPGQIAIRQGEGILLRGTDPGRQAAREELAILGNAYHQGMASTALRLPDLSIRSFPEDGELAQTLLTDGGSFDILSLSLSYMDFDSLMKKGYALPLNDVGGVSEFFQALPPALRESLSLNGQIFALPIAAQGSILLYDTLFFEQAGRTPPKTFGELLAFIADWDSLYAKDHPDRSPTGSDDLRRALIRTARAIYQNDISDSRKPFSWSGESLISMLEGIDKLTPAGSASAPGDREYEL